MKGVYFSKERQTWVARPWIGGKRIYLGSFKEKLEAEQAIKRATQYTLDTFKLYYERQDSGIKWLALYRARKALRQMKRRQAEAIDRKLKNW